MSDLGPSITHAALLHIESDGAVYCHVSNGHVALPESLSLGDLFRALAMAKEEEA